jgi:hypothetical protein
MSRSYYIISTISISYTEATMNRITYKLQLKIKQNWMQKKLPQSMNCEIDFVALNMTINNILHSEIQLRLLQSKPYNLSNER